MITCHRKYLEELCLERGFTLAAAMPCVVSMDGDMWTINVDHDSYPRVVGTLSFKCVEDCSTPQFECLPGYCCTENIFDGSNSCLPCDSSSSSSSPNIDCSCATLDATGHTIVVTLNGPYGLNNDTAPIEFPLTSAARISGCTFRSTKDLDTTIYTNDPKEIGCGSVIATLGLVNCGAAPCDCSTLEGCKIVLLSWEEDNCPGGIASVELMGNLCSSSSSSSSPTQTQTPTLTPPTPTQTPTSTPPTPTLTPTSSASSSSSVDCSPGQMLCPEGSGWPSFCHPESSPCLAYVCSDGECVEVPNIGFGYESIVECESECYSSSPETPTPNSTPTPTPIPPTPTLTPTSGGSSYVVTTSNGEVTIDSYIGAGGAVIIPSTIGGLPVVAIGDDAFYGVTGLTSVTIPSGVTSIGDSAFFNCTGLTSVTIPSGVTYIGNHAFAHNTGMPQSEWSVIIPSSVTSIEYGMFYNNTGLTSVTIPSSVTAIGNEAFYGCTGLTSVTIPSGVTLGYGAFQGCAGLTSVTIPNGVTHIRNFAFYGCAGLTSVTIPSSVISIGQSAFQNCTGLTSVTYLGTPPTLGADAFAGTNI